MCIFFVIQLLYKLSTTMMDCTRVDLLFSIVKRAVFGYFYAARTISGLLTLFSFALFMSKGIVF